MENFGLQQLGRTIYEHCGLNYLDNLSSLESKVTPRMHEVKVSSYWDYLRLLQHSKKEWDVLVEAVTINETYFYREDKQLHVYKNEILPSLLTKSPSEPVKVWSAACSSGEEPYSLAMMSLESAPLWVHRIQIQGTDINKKVLQTARNGVYNKNSLSFRRIPLEWKDTFFLDRENDYEISHIVKEMVLFKQLNLLDEEIMKREQGYDVIFCRNVLIYFDTETIKRVVSSFYHSLKKGGLLFLGHAESISHLGIGFETISADGAFYYRKN